ncbi:hypothetical protein JCM10213_001436 [Rhodosporidiobolus nylandii]
MPVPSLPLELIPLILTELRLFSGRDDITKRVTGRSIALVCRAWYPLGVALAWHDLVLDSPQAVKRVVELFERRPDLRCLLRNVDIIGNSLGGEPQVQSDHEPYSRIAEDDIVWLWANAPGIRSLEVFDSTWIRFDETVPYLHLLKNLQRSHIILFVPPTHLSTMFYAALFASLATATRLKVFCLITPCSEFRWIGPSLPSSSGPPLPLKTLSFMPIRSERTNDTRVFRRTLDLVQSATLTTLTAYLEPSDLPILDTLPRFDNLSMIALHLEWPDKHGPLVHHFLTILRTLSPRRLRFTLFAVDVRTPHLGLVPLPASFTLTSFLLALPSFVALATLSHFHLRSDSVPQAQPDPLPPGWRLASQVRLRLALSPSKDPVKCTLSKFDAGEAGDGTWYLS